MKKKQPKYFKCGCMHIRPSNTKRLVFEVGKETLTEKVEVCGHCNGIINFDMQEKR